MRSPSSDDRARLLPGPSCFRARAFYNDVELRWSGTLSLGRGAHQGDSDEHGQAGFRGDDARGRRAGRGVDQDRLQRGQRVPVHPARHQGTGRGGHRRPRLPGEHLGAEPAPRPDRDHRARGARAVAAVLRGARRLGHPRGRGPRPDRPHRADRVRARARARRALRAASAPHRRPDLLAARARAAGRRGAARRLPDGAARRAHLRRPRRPRDHEQRRGRPRRHAAPARPRAPAHRRDRRARGRDRGLRRAARAGLPAGARGGRPDRWTPR